MTRHLRRHAGVPDAARAALADTQLRRNLAHATRTIRAKRAAVVAEVEDWEELRLAGAAVKEARAAHLDHPPRDSSRSRWSRAGATVHWARDAAEACAIVADGRPRPRRRRGGQGQVDGDPGDRPQRGAGGRGDRRLGDRPRRAHRPARRRPALATSWCPRSTATGPRSARSSARRMGDVGRPAPDDLTDEPAVLAGAARQHLREKFLRAKVAVVRRQLRRRRHRHARRGRVRGQRPDVPDPARGAGVAWSASRRSCRRGPTSTRCCGCCRARRPASG